MPTSHSAREQLLEPQLGRQLYDRVAAVVRVSFRPVAGGGPDVAGRVDLGRGAAHPDATLAAVGHAACRVEVAGRSTFLGHRRDPAVVGPAVVGVAGVAELDVAAAQVQPGALQDVGGRLTGGIDRLVQQHGAREDVPSYEPVSWHAVDQLIGHREDLASPRVDNRRPRDADGRRDDRAAQFAARNGRADVGRPQDGTAVRGQGVHRVVLRRHEDATPEFERLAVKLAIEHGRRPGVRGRGERDARRVSAGPHRIPVIDGPRVVHSSRRGAGGTRW